MSGHEHCLQPFELIKRPSHQTLRAILRSTPFVPYGADAEAMQEDIADANSELEKLQDQIALATAQDKIPLSMANVRQLKSQRRSIQSYIKLREAIFAPIRQLPTEILLEIFLIASPSVSITATAGFPWKLGYVCGRWRDIVLSFPKLWSNINLGFPDIQISNRRGMQACNLLRLCLARSGQHPLSIRLWAHESNVEISRDIVKIALQVRNRWKNLRYTSGNWQCQQINNSDALLPPTLNLPMLQRLDFEPPRHFRLSIVSPSLESLDLTSFDNLSVQTLTQAWPRITHLKLRLYSRIDPDDFANTLLQLPELLELNILGLHQSNSPSIPVHLNRLLILKTALENPIIGNLTTPNLRTLLVRGESSTPAFSESLTGGQIIANLVQRSHCSIFRLILSSWRLSIRDLLGIVGVTPNVEHLDLLIKERKVLWEHLMYKGDLTLLPHLHTLNLDMISSSECRDVVRVVKSRAAPPLSLVGHGSSPGRLKNLSLRLPHVKRNKERLEIQYLDQLQGFGGLKVDFDGEPSLIV
ncbi:hypothetical protein K443DRAFT_124943 [Laccaria amethystina LaAM-08-1]|uniref:Unplaced genomic scaffold K443scaffold_230, whole genome shotgun sequence n=1 Tax=Laccaria amethystina LaAM-08-1 TaxID=1095629 RepID=A0A0C9XBP2_9AGAR|nr:hypothetical protein K443DRAFT_124943 [Laccaria amethystina LaAM-08-1]